jgi:hypothetical protein
MTRGVSIAPGLLRNFSLNALDWVSNWQTACRNGERIADVRDDFRRRTRP